MIRIKPTSIFLILLAALITSCTDAPITSTQDELEVTDFTGNTIRLSKPASKIVALAPHVVENVFSAGAGEHLIGVVAYSNYPEQAKSIELVGGYEKTNHEKIIELNPDLIIGWQSGNDHSSVNRLIELGYTVYIDQPDNLRDVAKSIQDIGVLTGNTEMANKVATEYLQELDKIEQRYQDAVTIPSFYQVWNKPLQTINGNHIISDAIEICGGNNIYEDAFAVAPIINIESVLERDPLAIIASGMSSARPEWLDEWKAWSSLTAVKSNNLFYVHPDHIQRHTVRLLLGIKAICQQFDSARQKLADEDGQ